MKLKTEFITKKKKVFRFPEGASGSKIARILGIERQTVWQWKYRDSIPLWAVKKVEEIPLDKIKA